jgi:hypothetical protein
MRSHDNMGGLYPKAGRSRNRNPVGGGPGNWPSLTAPTKELSQTQALTQACKAAAQMCSGQFTLGAGLRGPSSGLLAHGSGQNSECSSPRMEMEFGEVKIGL